MHCVILRTYPDPFIANDVSQKSPKLFCLFQHCTPAFLSESHTNQLWEDAARSAISVPSPVRPWCRDWLTSVIARVSPMRDGGVRYGHDMRGEPTCWPLCAGYITILGPIALCLIPLSCFLLLFLYTFSSIVSCSRTLNSVISTPESHSCSCISASSPPTTAHLHSSFIRSQTNKVQ